MTGLKGYYFLFRFFYAITFSGVITVVTSFYAYGFNYEYLERSLNISHDYYQSIGVCHPVPVFSYDAGEALSRLYGLNGIDQIRGKILSSISSLEIKKTYQISWIETSYQLVDIGNNWFTDAILLGLVESRPIIIIELDTLGSDGLYGMVVLNDLRVYSGITKQWLENFQRSLEAAIVILKVAERWTAFTTNPYTAQRQEQQQTPLLKYLFWLQSLCFQVQPAYSRSLNFPVRDRPELLFWDNNGFPMLTSSGCYLQECASVSVSQMLTPVLKSWQSEFLMKQQVAYSAPSSVSPVPSAPPAPFNPYYYSPDFNTECRSALLEVKHEPVRDPNVLKSFTALSLESDKAGIVSVKPIVPDRNSKPVIPDRTAKPPELIAAVEAEKAKPKAECTDNGYRQDISISETNTTYEKSVSTGGANNSDMQCSEENPQKNSPSGHGSTVLSEHEAVSLASRSSVTVYQSCMKAEFERIVAETGKFLRKYPRLLNLIREVNDALCGSLEPLEQQFFLGKVRDTYQEYYRLMSDDHEIVVIAGVMDHLDKMANQVLRHPAVRLHLSDFGLWNDIIAILNDLRAQKEKFPDAKRVEPDATEQAVMAYTDRGISSCISDIRSILSGSDLSGSELLEALDCYRQGLAVELNRLKRRSHFVHPVFYPDGLIELSRLLEGYRERIVEAEFRQYPELLLIDRFITAMLANTKENRIFANPDMNNPYVAVRTKDAYSTMLVWQKLRLGRFFMGNTFFRVLAVQLQQQGCVPSLEMGMLALKGSKSEAVNSKSIATNRPGERQLQRHGVVPDLSSVSFAVDENGMLMVNAGAYKWKVSPSKNYYAYQVMGESCIEVIATATPAKLYRYNKEKDKHIRGVKPRGFLTTSGVENTTEGKTYRGLSADASVKELPAVNRKALPEWTKPPSIMNSVGSLMICDH